MLNTFIVVLSQFDSFHVFSRRVRPFCKVVISSSTGPVTVEGLCGARSPGLAFSSQDRLARLGVASLAAEGLALDPAVQPNSGSELCSVPSRPKLGVPERRTCLAVLSD